MAGRDRTRDGVAADAPRTAPRAIANDGIRRSGDTRKDRSMFTQRSGSVASYAAVAVAAAIVSAVGTWSATQFVASSAAQPAALATGPLLTQPLADLPG